MSYLLLFDCLFEVWGFVRATFLLLFCLDLAIVCFGFYVVIWLGDSLDWFVCLWLRLMCCFEVCGMLPVFVLLYFTYVVLGFRICCFGFMDLICCLSVVLVVIWLFRWFVVLFAGCVFELLFIIVVFAFRYLDGFGLNSLCVCIFSVFAAEVGVFVYFSWFGFNGFLLYACVLFAIRWNVCELWFVGLYCFGIVGLLVCLHSIVI